MDEDHAIEKELFIKLTQDIKAPKIPPSGITKEDEPRGHGGYAMVFKGVAAGVKTPQVALKVFFQKPAPKEAAQLTKNIVREANVWASLEHPNILPLYGVSLDVHTRRIWLVSPWIANGDLRKYLGNKHDADCLSLARGIIQGVSYLHTAKILHEDIRATNVLVDMRGTPLLADFGLSRFMEQLSTIGDTSTSFVQGSFRWMAPERLRPDRFNLSIKAAQSISSDVYAVGMTLYELFVRKIPFEGFNDMTVLDKVLAGERMEHPGALAVARGMTPRLWEFMTSCWEVDRTKRPSLCAALQTVLWNPIDVASGASFRKGIVRNSHLGTHWSEVTILEGEIVTELEPSSPGVAPEGYWLGRTVRGEKGFLPGRNLRFDGPAGERPRPSGSRGQRIPQSSNRGESVQSEAIMAEAHEVTEVTGQEAPIAVGLGDPPAGITLTTPQDLSKQPTRSQSSAPDDYSSSAAVSGLLQTPDVLVTSGTTSSWGPEEQGTPDSSLSGLLPPPWTTSSTGSSELTRSSMGPLTPASSRHMTLSDPPTHGWSKDADVPSDSDAIYVPSNSSVNLDQLSTARGDNMRLEELGAREGNNTSFRAPPALPVHAPSSPRSSPSSARNPSELGPPERILAYKSIPPSLPPRPTRAQLYKAGLVTPQGVAPMTSAVDSPGSITALTPTTSTPDTPERKLQTLLKTLAAPIVNASKQRGGPISGGAFADVWRGVMQPGSVPVALKVLRLHLGGSDSQRLHRALAREVSVWRRLDHSNVLPFLGVRPDDEDNGLWLVSPWMENGDVKAYVRSHSTANRFALAMGVIKGVAYLHRNKIVHGDLKANNILVDGEHNPRLADFGLSLVLDDVLSEQATSMMFAGSVRWMSPERIQPRRFNMTPTTSRTLASDVHALGMTLYEIFTLKLPFHEITQMDVPRAITAGDRPCHPGKDTSETVGMSPTMWRFMERCWEEAPEKRPDLVSASALSSFQSLEAGLEAGSSPRSKVGDEGTQRSLFPGASSVPLPGLAAQERGAVGEPENVVPVHRDGEAALRSLHDEDHRKGHHLSRQGVAPQSLHRLNPFLDFVDPKSLANPPKNIEHDRELPSESQSSPTQDLWSILSYTSGAKSPVPPLNSGSKIESLASVQAPRNTPFVTAPIAMPRDGKAEMEVRLNEGGSSPTLPSYSAWDLFDQPADKAAQYNAPYTTSVLSRFPASAKSSVVFEPAPQKGKMHHDLVHPELSFLLGLKWDAGHALSSASNHRVTSAEIVVDASFPKVQETNRSTPLVDSSQSSDLIEGLADSQEPFRKERARAGGRSEPMALLYLQELYPRAAAETVLSSSNSPSHEVSDVIIQNLDASISETTLRRTFEKYGDVIHVTISPGVQQEKIQLCCASVTFHFHADAVRAAREMQSALIGTQRITTLVHEPAFS